MAINFDRYGPYDAGPGANATENLWRNITRWVRPAGVLSTKKVPAEANEMLVTAHDSGLRVRVQPGEVLIHGHWGRSAGEKVLELDAAHTSQPRVDLVVVRADFLNDLIELDVLKGTPATTPVAPSPAVNSAKAEVPLAQVFVAAAATSLTDADVTDVRFRHGFGMWQFFEPPLYYEGAYGTLGRNQVNMGSGAKRTCYFRRDGQVVQLRYRFTWGSPPYNIGTGRIYTTLPPGMVAADSAGATGTDHRIPSHLYTTSNGLMHFNGNSLVSPGDTRVWPFFSTNANDTRIRWYVGMQHGAGQLPQTPFISGGRPEGGFLDINGVLEIR